MFDIKLLLLIISSILVVMLLVLIPLFYFGFISCWHIGFTNYYRPKDKEARKVYVKLTRRVAFYFTPALVLAVVAFITFFFDPYYVSVIFSVLSFAEIMSSLVWFNISKRNKQLIKEYQSIEKEAQSN